MYSLKALFASLPRTERGKAIVLGGDPKGQNFLYVNGISVYLREIDNPSVAEVYTEHSVQATVAKYSPSGFYIASGDNAGKIRIWDATKKEHILKNEFQPLSGSIKDLAWSSDSQRIVVVGEGREKFGHVFNADTGTSVGEIMGQSKMINAVDFRPPKPFRIATGSEDNSVAFFHGPPFKFQFTTNEHNRFVNALRYAPDGSVFVSGGADGKAVVYDGQTGQKVSELGNPAHKGGIYALSFSPDSQQVLTVSGDKTAKIWAIADQSLVQEFVLGNAVEDMQVGCIWQREHLITVSLSGYINYLDRNDPKKPLMIIKGHNKPITALAVSEDSSTICTGSSDGGICLWNSSSGANDMLGGKGHPSQVQDMTVVEDMLLTIGIDDTIGFSSVTKRQFGTQLRLPSQPRGLAAKPGGLIVVACVNELVVLMNNKIVHTAKVTFEPNCAAISADKADVAAGGGKDSQVHIFTLTPGGSGLQERQVLVHGGAVTDVKYSPDGRFLASCDTNRKVLLFQMPDYHPLVTTDWANHTARVNTLSWSPDSKHLASGSLDTNICVWSPGEKSKHVMVKGAHPTSQVTRVQWLDNHTLASVGQDSCLRQWSFTHS